MDRGSGLHVLVVDDDPILGDLFVDVLVLSGHRGRVARTGAAALGLLARERFDVVISDLLMPEMDGEELWEKLKIEHPRLAETMIFVSAGNPGSPHARFLERTKHRCLRKPFRIPDLLALVEAAGNPSRSGDASRPPGA